MAKDKVVVITGASSGFGKGIARQLAARGAHLVLAARRGDLIDELAAECAAAGVQAEAVTTDVSLRDDVFALGSAALHRFGRIDVWINNAGATALGRFEEIPMGDHIRVIETDLLGCLYGSHFALRQFRDQRRGTLINVASVAGRVPVPYMSSYVAAKAGMLGLSASLRQELQLNEDHEIRVCTVLPTSMDTPFFEHAANYSGHEATPVPPLYDAAEVIETVVELVDSPRDEVTVGGAAAWSSLLHNVAPGLTEQVMARHAHKAQMEDAPPARDTSGSLLAPSGEGTGVSGGLRGRR